MPEYLPRQTPDRAYQEVMSLTNDELALIAACEFMVGHVANPYVSAIGVWVDDPDAMFIRPTLLQQCQRQTMALAKKLEIINQHLPKLQTHVKPEIAALHQPMSESYHLLKRIHTLGARLTELIAGNIDTAVDPASPLSAELTAIDVELTAIRATFAPLMPLVNGNPAYRTYRARVKEDRKLDKLLKP